MLFALELINSNNNFWESHAQVFSTGVPTSSQHNFYPLEFSCFSHFVAPPPSTGCCLSPRQPPAEVQRCGCLCRALLPLHCSLPLPKAGIYLRTEIPDLWGTCMLGCQQGGEATLSTLRGVAPWVCPSPSPWPAYRENLSPEPLEWLLAPSWRNFTLTLKMVVVLPPQSAPLWVTFEKFPFVTRGRAGEWMQSQDCTSLCICEVFLFLLKPSKGG